MILPQQYWVTVQDPGPNGSPYGSSSIACSRCGYRSPYVTVHNTRCPQCGPVYEVLETLLADVEAIKARLE
jgi:PHP family Zn ribbon phosphoesterase